MERRPHPRTSLKGAPAPSAACTLSRASPSIHSSSRIHDERLDPSREGAAPVRDTLEQPEVEGLLEHARKNAPGQVALWRLAERTKLAGQQDVRRRETRGSTLLAEAR